MAVSQRIIDLIDLALEDRIITYKERQTIVEAATKEGASKKEINSLLNSKLSQRLRQLSKEELKRCPSCGAQIPLISDQCLYCGHILEKPQHKDQHNKAKHISGKEADIIRAENLRTEAEEINIEHCPDCGAPFPLLSNICMHCGHVLHARKGNELNIKNLINNIKESTQKLKDAPPVSFSNTLGGYAKIIGAISIFFSINLCADFIESINTESGAVLLSFVLAAIILLGLVIYSGYLIWTSVNAIVDQAYDTNSAEYILAKLEYTKHKTFVDALYGDNAEAKDYLQKLNNEILQIEKKHNTNVLIFVGLCIVAIAIPVAIAIIF